MALTSLATFAPGDTIPSAWANLIRDNFLAIDSRTGGDPGGTGKFLMGNGATAGAWVASATALDDRVAVAGDTLSGILTIVKNTGAADTGLYARAGLTVETTDGSRPAIGFARDGTGAAALYFESSNSLILIPTSGTGGALWHSGNDGPSSGLDAQTAATATSATTAGTATSATTAGSAASATTAGNATNVTTSIGGVALASYNAPSATSASDSAALGGVAAASYLQKSGAATLSSPNWTIGGIMTLGAGQVNFGGAVDIAGNCVVHGSKPRCATGHDGNQALWYANETPVPVFEDFGRAQTVDGVAVVPIDPGAANYLALGEADYHVYLTAEGAARPYVAGRTPTSFTVRVLDGEPDIGFVWRILAVQGDMPHIERNLPVGDPDHA